MKPIDIDKLFEKHLRSVMSRNVGKFTEEEWEERLPEIYEKFGDAPLMELDGESPRSYFKNLDGEAQARLLAAYVRQGVSVPDYLCDAIMQTPAAESALLAFVTPKTEEELFFFAVNLLEDLGSTAPLNTYVDGVFDSEYSIPERELMIEMLAAHAQLVSDEILARYDGADESTQAMLLDVIVEGKKCEKAFSVLMDAFTVHDDELPLYAQYLSKYGDERALPALYRAIEQEGLDYVSFQELRSAIESLGGVYEKERDFSHDRFFHAVKNADAEEDSVS